MSGARAAVRATVEAAEGGLRRGWLPRRHDHMGVVGKRAEVAIASSFLKEAALATEEAEAERRKQLEMEVAGLSADQLAEGGEERLPSWRAGDEWRRHREAVAPRDQPSELERLRQLLDATHSGDKTRGGRVVRLRGARIGGGQATEWARDRYERE